MKKVGTLISLKLDQQTSKKTNLNSSNFKLKHLRYERKKLEKENMNVQNKINLVSSEEKKMLDKIKHIINLTQKIKTNRKNLKKGKVVLKKLKKRKLNCIKQ